MSEVNQNVDHDENVEVKEEETKQRFRTNAEVQLSSLSFSRKGKKKYTKSLYDTPMEDRTYWGNDKGSDLEMTLTRIEINRSLRKGEMLDIKNCQSAARLNKEYITELMQYQLHLMTMIADEDECNIFKNINGNGFIMVDVIIEDDKKVYNFVVVE
jgi:hypothetical protein